jgi:hypothetical protein
MNQFKVENNPSITKITTISTPKCEIRIFGEEFKDFLTLQQNIILFFDGSL